MKQVEKNVIDKSAVISDEEEVYVYRRKPTRRCWICFQLEKFIKWLFPVKT